MNTPRLNAMFKQKSNPAFNNNLFNSPKIIGMHPQMKRLYEAAAELKGISGQSSLARALNVSPQVVKNWESRGISKQGMMDAEATIGCSWLWLKTGQGDMTKGVLDEGSNLEEAPELRPFSNVPVVGTVQGGDNGFFTELEYPIGYGDGSITYPAKDKNSYALRVRGDSMRPRIKNGEFIVVEPNHLPQPGDDVVVCLRDGRKMVKELLYTRDGEVTLGSINNGHGNITVATDQVETMHYVAAIIPRGAFYKS